MQKLFQRLAGLFAIGAVFLIFGCEEDPVIPPVDNPLPPIVRFVTEAGFLDADSDISAGETFKVRLAADIGTSNLKSLTIYKGVDKLGTDMFEINGGAIGSNNPALITGADETGLTWDIAVTGPATFNETAVYEFVVEDAEGLQDAITITITTTGEPISTTINGVLFNQAGPAGTGGLDLDTGTGTGSTDAAAEIRDLGIDCNLANDSNWRMQIGTVNDADMVKVDMSVETFEFDVVDTKEIISTAYSTGIALADGESVSCGGTTTAVTDVSDAVVPGDMFIVNSNDIFYLIRVDAVNATADNNDDNYELSIKF